MSTQENIKRGVRLRVVNAVIITIALILAVLLMVVTVDATKSYREMRQATDQYIESQIDAAQLEAASDYLTEQVRAFVVTGEKQYLDNYFEEANVTKRRDSALESLDHIISGKDTLGYLSSALDYSNELMEVEFYAMKLKAESIGLSSSLPEEIASVALSSSDAIISREAKSQKALTLVFDSEYHRYKDLIKTNVDLCTNSLISDTRTRETESSDHMLRMVHLQEVLLAVMVLTFFAVVLMTSRFVIKPLETFVKAIKDNGLMPMTGSEEVRFLARNYNEVYEKSQAHQEKLSYAANHDALTGLYNRSVFESVRSSDERRAHALLLVDTDKFKEVNDTYGHDTGDAILKKIAGILQHSFRSEDYVCRIGGDEFAVIMVHVGPEFKGLIKSKMEAANAKLADTSDGLPPVSVTVGVAFSSDDPERDIFKEADLALYRQKNERRGGLAFYE